MQSSPTESRRLTSRLSSQAVTLRLDFGHAVALQVWGTQSSAANSTGPTPPDGPSQDTLCTSSLTLTLAGGASSQVWQLPAVLLSLELLSQQWTPPAGRETADALLGAVSIMLPGFTVQRPQDEADDR